MRRQQSEVTDIREIHRILSLTNIGRLATLGADGYPYITPVNFVNDGSSIYFHCAPKGEKLDNIERNNRVCFEVDIPLAYMNIDAYPDRPVCQLHQFYHCVIIRGSASIVQDNTRKAEMLNRLIAKHENTTEFEPVTKDTPALKRCHVVEIIPMTVTAKSDLGQKIPEDMRSAVARYFADRDYPGDPETVKAMGYRF